MAGIKHKPSTGKLTRARWQEAHDVETLDMIGQTADPASPAAGQMWYRSDLGQLRGVVGGRVVILSEPGDEAVEVLETTTAAGLAATTNGQLFAVASGGSIAIYRNFGGSAVLARGNFQTAPVPAVAPAAPAIVASAQALRTGGVPLKLALSRSYSSGNDAAATLNARLPELAAEGLTVVDPDGMTVRCTEPLRPVSRMRMDFGHSTAIIRGISGTGTNEGLFCPEDLSEQVSDLYIRGARWIAETPGVMWSIWAHDSVFDSVWIEEFSQGAALIWGGDRTTFISPRVFSNAAAVFGVDTCRYFGGTGSAVHGGYFSGGDDGFAVSPVTNPSSPRYNQAVDQFLISNTRAFSRGARAFFIGVAGDATAPVRNVQVQGGAGSGPQGAIVILTNAVTGAAPRQLDRIMVSHFEVRTTEAAPDLGYAAAITATTDGTIGQVDFDGVTIRDSANDVGIQLAAAGSVFNLRNSNIEGRRHGLQIAKGGVIRSNSRIASTGVDAVSPINIFAGAGAPEIYLDGTPHLDGVGTGYGAIRSAVGSGARVYGGQVRMTKAPGATDTRAASSGPDASIRLDGVQGDIDEPGVFGAAALSGGIVNASGSSLATVPVVIATSANLSLGVDDLGEITFFDGPLTRSPTTHNINNVRARAGDRPRLYNRDTTGRPLVFTAAAGTVTLGTLTAAGQWLDIVFDGTAWQVAGGGAA